MDKLRPEATTQSKHIRDWFSNFSISSESGIARTRISILGNQWIREIDELQSKCIRDWFSASRRAARKCKKIEASPI